MRAEALAPQHGHHLLEVGGGTGQAVAQFGGKVGDLFEVLGDLAGAVHHRHLQLRGRIFVRCECAHSFGQRSTCGVSHAQPGGTVDRHVTGKTLGLRQFGTLGGHAFLLGIQRDQSLALFADRGVGCAYLLAQLAFVSAEVFSADTRAVELRAQGLELFILLLVLFLEFLRFANGGAEIFGHSLGRSAGGCELLTECPDLVTGGSEGLLCLFGGSALNAPGADVLLLGVEFLELVAGFLEGTGSTNAALVDGLQWTTRPVDGVEQYLKF